jgi:hypothetical protein
LFVQSDIKRNIYFSMWLTRVLKKYGEPEHEMQEDGHVQVTQVDNLKESFSDTN